MWLLFLKGTLRRSLLHLTSLHWFSVMTHLKHVLIVPDVLILQSSIFLLVELHFDHHLSVEASTTLVALIIGNKVCSQ